MNLLGISPNMLYKNFITNTDLLRKIELEEKISTLDSKKLTLC